MSRHASRRWLVVGVSVGLLIGSLVGALAVAWSHPSADTSAIDNATKNLLVTAQVESQPVRQLSSVAGSLIMPTTVPLVTNGPSSAVSSTTVVGGVSDAGASDESTVSDGSNASSGSAVSSGMSSIRIVVSGGVHAVGDVLSVGDLVAEVSGSPVFAIDRSVPLYRDVVEGIEGNDVVALQQMLVDIGLYEGPADGKLQTGTVKALAAMYDRAGYDLPELAPGKKGVPLGQTVSLSAGAVVASVAMVGEEVTADHPLMSVQTSPAVFTARVDMLQVPAFSVGTAVDVQIGSADALPSVVTAASDFMQAESSTPAGYDITVAVPGGLDAASLQDEPVVVREQGEAPTGPAVPLTAVRYDASGQAFVLLAQPSAGESASAPTRTPVTVVAQVAGYVVIADDPVLPLGATVILAGA